jgi:hypothetical protein
MHFQPGKVAQLLQEKKFAKNWSGICPKENHRGLLIDTAILFDEDGISIPGMTLQIEFRVPTVVDDCLKLEVCPTDKLSHNGEEPIYGPQCMFAALRWLITFSTSATAAMLLILFHQVLRQQAEQCVRSVLNGPCADSHFPLIIVDDRAEPRKAKNEIGILASLVRTQSFSSLVMPGH